MDALSLSASAAAVSTTSLSIGKSNNRATRLAYSFPFARRKTSLSFRSKFVVLACNEESSKNLDKWEQMELKFGRMLGEDPKLTLAKIMARKSNPDASYLEIEKAFYKNKGKIDEVKEVPFDTGAKNGKSTTTSSLGGLNLVRPVPKKGFQDDYKPVALEPSQPVQKVDEKARRTVPNVILRKPTSFYEDPVKEKPSQFSIKPNLNLKMGKEQSGDGFTDMTLLSKPEPLSIKENEEKKPEPSSSSEAKTADDVGRSIRNEGAENSYLGFQLLQKPEARSVEEKSDVEHSQNESSESNVINDCEANGLEGLQSHNRNISESTKVTAAGEFSNNNAVDSTDKFFFEAALQGRPERLDQSVNQRSKSNRAEASPANPQSYGTMVAAENRVAGLPLEEQEEKDWARAENLVNKQVKREVELISASPKGFAVSFGSLIGFLPYRNFAAKWKFWAFESWLRHKGIDPSKYRQNLGIIGSNGLKSNTSVLESIADPQVDVKIDGEVSPDMKLDDLLKIYDQEKLKFLSSFVGQKVKVNVVLADRSTRKLIFSARPKEKEELVQKKKNLMAKLRIGDVVKCCIKKITYFGIFVEVEGVPALIHQTEVSWDATLDPVSHFKIGQIIEAKVYQLDFALDRIFLSLKEITPDPLNEALESVIGDHNTMEGRLEAAEADMEWPDVESLIKELQQIEGIQSVSKGRFFLSPGLAPTFQVYMASMFEDQYKILARAGNKVQEVIVEASLGKEEMKSVILACTNRVV